MQSPETFQKRKEYKIDSKMLDEIAERAKEIAKQNKDHDSSDSFDKFLRTKVKEWGITHLDVLFICETGPTALDEIIEKTKTGDLHQGVFEGHSHFTLALLGGRSEVIHRMLLEQPNLFKTFKERWEGGLIPTEVQTALHFKAEFLRTRKCTLTEEHYQLIEKTLALSKKTLQSQNQLKQQLIHYLFEDKPGDIFCLMLVFEKRILQEKLVDHHLLSATLALDKTPIFKLFIGFLETLPTHKGYTVLHSTVRWNRYEAARFVLEESEKAIDINAKVVGKDRFTALLCALVDVKVGVDFIKLLLKHGADPNCLDDQDGYTPFLLAAEKWGPETLELLIARGAKVNVKSRENQGALMIAVRQRLHKNVKFLLTKCPQLLPDAINAIDGFGLKPLWMAAKLGAFEIVELLVQAGADINEQLKSGTPGSPLEFAFTQPESAPAKQIKTTETLLRLKADVNLQHKEDGMTPLIVAAGRGQVPIARLLIDHRAQIDHKAREGTAMVYAVDNGLGNNFVDFLLQAKLARPDHYPKLCDQDALDLAQRKQKPSLGLLWAAKLFDNFKGGEVEGGISADRGVDRTVLFETTCFLVTVFEEFSFQLNKDDSLSLEIISSTTQLKIRLSLSTKEIETILVFMLEEKQKNMQFPTAETIVDFILRLKKDQLDLSVLQERFNKAKEATVSLSHRRLPLQASVEAIAGRFYAFHEEITAKTIKVTSKANELKNKVKNKDAIRKIQGTNDALKKTLTQTRQSFDIELAKANTLSETLERRNCEMDELMEENGLTEEIITKVAGLIEVANSELENLEKSQDALVGYKILLRQNDTTASDALTKLTHAQARMYKDQNNEKTLARIEAGQKKTEEKEVAERKQKEEERLQSEKNKVEKRNKDREKWVASLKEKRELTVRLRELERNKKEEARLLRTMAIQGHAPTLSFGFKPRSVQTINQVFEIDTQVAVREELKNLKNVCRECRNSCAQAKSSLVFERFGLLGALARVFEFAKDLQLDPVYESQEAELIRDYIFHGDEIAPLEKEMDEKADAEFNQNLLSMIDNIILEIENAMNKRASKEAGLSEMPFYIQLLSTAQAHQAKRGQALSASESQAKLNDLEQRIIGLNLDLTLNRGGNINLGPQTRLFAEAYIKGRRGAFAAEIRDTAIPVFQAAFSARAGEYWHYIREGTVPRHEMGYGRPPSQDTLS